MLRLWRITPVTLVVVLSTLHFLAGGVAVGALTGRRSSAVRRVVVAPGMAYCIEIASGWKSGYLTPDAQRIRGGCSNARVQGVLSGEVPMSFFGFYRKQGADEGGCDRADYTFVDLVVFETQTPGTPVVPRPTHFGPRSGTGVGAVDHDCEDRGQVIDFVENGRTIEVQIGIGKDADPRRVAQAYAMLDSLTLM